MMEDYKIIITSKAHLDIADIVGFLVNVSEKAAIEISNSIYSGIKSLSTLPERNPLFKLPNIGLEARKLIVVKRYIIIYAIIDKDVVIYRVLDARRSFEGLL